MKWRNNRSIEEFVDQVNWYNISMNQKLSEEFIIEIANKVDWNYISMNNTQYINLIARNN